MAGAFSRTELLIGADAMRVLEGSTVAVFGLGGVGSWAAEALARCGVGGLLLVDSDIVGESNINRQVHAATSSLGRPKVEAMRDRVLDINPRIRVEARIEFCSPSSAAGLFPPGLSYAIDAIDSIASKLDLIARARDSGVPVISAMGTGNKLDPSRLEVADISRTSVCPLARVVRKELRKRGVRHLKVVYSREPPARVGLEAKTVDGGQVDDGSGPGPRGRRRLPGSVPFVPAAAGFLIAAEVVRDLLAAARARAP